MRQIIKENRVFIITYLVLWSSATVICLIYPKGDIHLFMNRFHCNACDHLFRYLTFLGDGWFTVGVTVVLLFIRFRFALMVAASNLSAGILVQVLKRFVFTDSPRPALYLKDVPELYLVPGIDLHYHHSFPSGHSASAFALMITFALIAGKKWAAMLLLILACMVAYSRVYLSQHFLGDILAGSVPGFLAAFIFYWYFQGLKKRWPDQSIVTLLQ